MPLPIKTAVDPDGRTVRAVLVTASFTSEDIDNLVGQPVDTTVTTTATPDPYAATFTDVSFYAPGPAVGLVQHTAGTTVPGYLIWDGQRMSAATPRQFAQRYTVIARVTPAPRISHHHG